MEIEEGISAEADNTLQDRHNSSDYTKAKFSIAKFFQIWSTIAGYDESCMEF